LRTQTGADKTLRINRTLAVHDRIIRMLKVHERASIFTTVFHVKYL
jgi:hypothetical protein